MKAFETTTTVEPTGRVLLKQVPFQPGTEVDVIVTPKRASPGEFQRAWDEFCRKVRALPQIQSITDEEIQTEIDGHRARG